MAIELGSNATHDLNKGGDGRSGKVVRRMVVDHLDGTQEVNVVIEYVDAAGQTSQAWFPESAVTQS